VLYPGRQPKVRGGSIWHAERLAPMFCRQQAGRQRRQAEGMQKAYSAVEKAGSYERAPGGASAGAAQVYGSRRWQQGMALAARRAQAPTCGSTQCRRCATQVRPVTPAGRRCSEQARRFPGGTAPGVKERQEAVKAGGRQNAAVEAENINAKERNRYGSSSSAVYGRRRDQQSSMRLRDIILAGPAGRQ